MPRLWTSTRSLMLLAFVAAGTLLTACGGASGDAASGGAPIDSGVSALTVIVTADVNDDGLPDVLELPVDAGDDAEPRCWHGRRDGSFETDGATDPNDAIDAIRDDLQRRPDHDILGDEGAHQAPTASGTLPYAVLHMARADGLDADEPGPPVIDELRPSRGQVGALVAITGSDLAARDARTSVRFDDLDARVLLALPRFVLTIVPDRAPLGAIDLVVTRGEETSRAATFTVVERPTPQLDSVAPAPLVPGVLAVLRGSDLGTPADDVSVTFGGVAATRVLALGSILFAEVPAGAATGLVIVTVDGVASNGIDAVIGDRLDAPSLTRITPAAASPGSLVRLEGDDLFVIGQAPQVRFGTKRAQLFGIERGALVAIVPAAADGDVTVTVGGRTSDGVAFDLLRRGTPTIDRIDPSTGERGDRIDILGTDLHDLTGLGDGASPATIAARLPQVTFDRTRAWFVFPIVGGLRVVVPFTASIGENDVVVELGTSKSDPAAFTVR